jgi:hypothetical protein
MGQKQTGRYCAHCQKNVMASGTTPNHLLHFFLSLVTFEKVENGEHGSPLP